MGGGSAMSSLRDGLQNLKPSTPGDDKTVTAPAVEPEQKKEFPPIGSSDIKEHKQVESATDAPAEPGSALEGFRTDLIKSRRAKEKAQIKANEPSEDAPAIPPTKSKEPVSDEPPVTDEEIQKTIDDPAISKRHQKRMIFLATQKKELERRLAEAEAKPQTGSNDEKIKELTDKSEAAQKELIQFQRRYSLESEPELKKFDEVAGKADEAIYSKLKGRISDKTIDLIKGMGGFGGFSKSGQVFNIEVEVDGEKTTQQVTASQLAKRWLSDMDVEDSEFIRVKLGERVNALESKKSRAEALAAESDTWFKAKQDEQTKAVQQHQDSIKANQDAYAKWVSSWSDKQDWLKDKVAPADASDSDKAEIASFNKGNEAVRVLLKAAASPTTVDDYVALVEQAATTQHLRRENVRITKAHEELQQKYEKLRGGINTTGKSGGASIARAPVKAKDESASEALRTPVADSLREAMENLRVQQAG
jgi:hypothetical protein